MRLDLAEDELDFAGFDGVFHLAGPAGRPELRRRLPLYLRRNVLASQRVFEAAARDGVARRLRFVVVGLRRRRALPDAGGHDAAAALALRDHEARLRAARRRVRARVRPRLRRAALLQRLRAAAAARHGVHADRERARRRARRSRSTATATSRAAGRTSATSSTRRSSPMERGTGTYNVGGALEASLNETIALLEQISGRTLEVDRAARRCPATSAARAPTRPGSAGARLGAVGLPRGGSARRSGSGPSTRVPLA